MQQLLPIAIKSYNVTLELWPKCLWRFFIITFCHNSKSSLLLISQTRVEFYVALIKSKPKFDHTKNQSLNPYTVNFVNLIKIENFKYSTQRIITPKKYKIWIQLYLLAYGLLKFVEIYYISHCDIIIGYKSILESI